MATKNSTALKKLRRSWYLMWRRCTNPKDKDFKRYGGRGICVCERWKSFDLFVADMGERPNDKSIDRIDNSGPYSPENCRWATPKEQSRNRRNNRSLTINGETMLIAEWAEKSGLDQRRVNNRLWWGTPIERAVLPGDIRARGERQHLAKLTDEKVRQIRLERNAGATYAALGRKYGVHESAIKLACIRKTWKHVQ